MTENIKCPNCGSTIENERGFSYMTCYQCGCKWDESKRQPQAAPTGDKSECINLAEQARDLIDFLQTDGCLDCDEYNTLQDTVNTIQNYIENSQPLNAWIKCSERLPEAWDDVLINDGSRYMAVGHVDEENDWYVGLACDDEAGIVSGIIYWHPLPQPPETGKDGE